MITTTLPMHAVVDTLIERPLSIHDTETEATLSLPRGAAPHIDRAFKVLPVLVTIELAPTHPLPMHHQPALQLITRG